MKIAVTGPQGLTAYETDQVLKRIGQLERGDTLLSGGAYGVDTVAALHAAHHLGMLVELVVPVDLRWNGELPELLGGRCGRIHRISGSYMDRNDALAELADELLAFPYDTSERLRSGTWATIRRFRKLEKTISIIPIGET